MENFKYCECGEEIIYVGNYIIGPQYYYCSHCDKLFHIKLEEIKDGVNTNRKQEMKNLAMFYEAKNKVTKKDLIKIGLLKDQKNAINKRENKRT